MKKYLFLIILSYSLQSCQNNLNQLKKDDITHIDVYYIPFSILLPVEITGEQIKSNSIKTTINDSLEIHQIYDKLLLLKEVKNVDFINTGIYLRVDFYNNNKENLKLLFDKNHFKIGDDFYIKDKDLIELLIK